MIDENSRILITGGTGSFGKTILAELLKVGVGEVRVLSRDEEKQDDVDTESEDHLQDETRYFIASVAVGMRTGTTRG